MIKEKHILFVDTLGRLLMGKEDWTTPNTSDIVRIKNPAIIHATHKQEGGMSITFIPIVFREFLADKDEGVIFQYARSTISIAEDTTTLDARITGQYDSMFTPLQNIVPIPAMPQTPAPATAPTQARPVIKLFDN